MKTAIEMVERMEALVRKMTDRFALTYLHEIFQEAEAIVSELPDPDAIEASIIQVSHTSSNRNSEMVLAAIKRGRELERAKLQHGEG